MLGGRGGRHGGLPTWDEEEAVLTDISDRALNGLVAITQPIRACVERRLGRAVPGSGSGTSSLKLHRVIVYTHVYNVMLHGPAIHSR